MILRINSNNCAKGNWSAYKFIGNNHESIEVLLTFKVSAWSVLGTYDKFASWCCLFAMNIPWSYSWENNI